MNLFLIFYKYIPSKKKQKATLVSLRSVQFLWDFFLTWVAGETHGLVQQNDDLM